jgi:hypothetical protein
MELTRGARSILEVRAFARTQPPEARAVIESLCGELALMYEALGVYATDEDEYLDGTGEPYGSIQTELGILARMARRVHQELESAES